VILHEFSPPKTPLHESSNKNIYVLHKYLLLFSFEVYEIAQKLFNLKVHLHEFLLNIWKLEVENASISAKFLIDSFTIPTDSEANIMKSHQSNVAQLETACGIKCAGKFPPSIRTTNRIVISLEQMLEIKYKFNYRHNA
jgi:hypothetical protein